MIKAVILDAYGTIFYTGTGSVDAMAKILKHNDREDLDPAEVYAHLKELHRENTDGLKEFITEAEVFRMDIDQIHEAYGLTADPEEDTRIMLSIQGTRTAYPDSRKAIERMQEKVQVVIGSTTDTRSLELDLERAGIVPDRIFTSESMRVYKPVKAFYETILQELDLEPEEALFAGDSLLDDVYGPHQAGIRSCWINRRGEKLKENDPQPEYIAEDLMKLAAIICDEEL